MPPLTEQRIREIIREEIYNSFIKGNNFVFEKNIRILDGKNIQTGLTTGTKIGTETTQKIGLYGKLPVVQGSAITAAPTMSDTYVQSEQVLQCDRINNLITALENIGIIAEN